MLRSSIVFLSCMPLALSGCIADDFGPFTGAEAGIAASIDGPHSDRLCVPDPHQENDSVTIKMDLDLEGTGEFRMTGWDGPTKVHEVSGDTNVRYDEWHRGWNTGEICIDVELDAKGTYAIAAYLD